jgi:hypothetical protein
MQHLSDAIRAELALALEGKLSEIYINTKRVNNGKWRVIVRLQASATILTSRRTYGKEYEAREVCKQLLAIVQVEAERVNMHLAAEAPGTPNSGKVTVH